MNNIIRHFVILYIFSTSLFAAGSLDGSNNAISAPDPTYLYKVLTDQQLKKMQRHGFDSLYGTKMDKEDGYLHVCTAKQVQFVSENYFSDLEKGYLLQFDYALTKDKIKWVTDPKGEIFPHLYGVIPKKAIVKIHPFSTQHFDFSSLSF